MCTCETLIEAHDLVLVYGSAIILKIAGLKVEGERGQIIGLAGVNGVGKSTFLRACLGLHKPDAGSIKLLGTTAGTAGFRSLLARVGYVPQARPAGVLRLTVREVVECGRYGRIGFLGRRSDRDREAVASAMVETGVQELAERAIQELSGGQYQRVQIARALAGEPELVLLDEPSSHLDAEGRAGVLNVIVNLARERKASMLIVSHDEDLLGLADALLVCAAGCVDYHRV